MKTLETQKTLRLILRGIRFGLLLCSFTCGTLGAQPVDPELDPVFSQNSEIVLSPLVAPAGAIQEGTAERPIYVGGGTNFDQFMRSFRDVVNITFRLMEGVFETAGTYEPLPGRTPSPDLWQPGNGWRILGAGMGKTILKLVNPQETGYTKYHVLGTSGVGRFIEHLEVAHLTVDADGARHARTLDSSFGCVAIRGSWIHLHHLNCINPFNALHPRALNAALHRELFVLLISGQDGYQCTNNWIRSCRVSAHPDSPKIFPGAIEGLTSLLVNAANTNGRDEIGDYSWRPRILDCFVDGASPQRRVNGLGMFGCVDGLCQGNVAINSRQGFYSDSAPWTPRLFLLNNLISNSLFGIYFNYQVPQNRWGEAIVQSNVIYSCKDCATNSNGFTVGISFLGLTNSTASSFDGLIISSNLITGSPRPPGSPTTSDTSIDYGIQVINARASLVYNNTLILQRSYRSLLTLPLPSLIETTRFCRNVDGSGVRLQAINMGLPNCNASYLSDQTACLFPEHCPEGDVFDAPFDFAEPIPAPYPPPLLAPSAKNLVLLAREGQLIAPTFTNVVAGAWDGVSVVSTNLGLGGVRFHVYIPDARTYQTWVKLKPPTAQTTGFFDVEWDGERRLFGALNVSAGSNWAWHILTERLPGGTVNTTRRNTLSVGWHTLTFWTRNPGVQLDMICLSSATEQSFLPNDAVIRSLLLSQPASTTRAKLARECPWNTSIEVETLDPVSPMKVIGDTEARGGLALRSLVPHRGEVRHRFALPTTQLYEIAVRVKPAFETPQNRTLVMILDGQEWIMAAEATPTWQWISRAGVTEEEATSAVNSTRTFRLTSGWHRVTLRTRNPGVSLDALEIRAVAGTPY